MAMGLGVWDMTAAADLQWDSPGPVATAFWNSRAPVHGIQGPVGSGKTTAALMKGLDLARQQSPSPRDGERKFKLCVVRDTYRQLWRSTLKSWWKRVPQAAGKWQGGGDAPAVHELVIWENAVGEGSPIRYTIDFVAIGQNKAEDVLRGYEPTAFYLNELDLLNKDVLEFALNRCGRYPDMADGGPAWWGVMFDANAPVFDSWFYDRFYKALPKDWDYFVQPSGLAADAENLQNLPEGYYTRAMAGQSEGYIRRFIENKVGFSAAGKPVFPMYNDFLHCRPFEAVNELPLRLGSDAGRTPAATIGQRMPNGQWRVLREIVTENMGAKVFGETVSRILAEEFSGFDIAQPCWGDPAAQYAGDQDELSWLQIVSKVTGLKWRPAPGGNKLTVRLGAVERLLSQMIDGEPAYLIHPRCEILRAGFNAGYRFRKVNLVNEERYDMEKPEKNEYSHVQDANQNMVLGEGEYLEVMERRGRRTGPPQTQAISEDMPEGGFDDPARSDLRAHVAGLRERAFGRAPRSRQDYAISE